MKIGVSSCLAGELVRYDGATKLVRWVCELEESVEVVRFCPEVGAGMPVPRPPIQVVLAGQTPRIKMVESRQDLTEAMHRYINDAIATIRTSPLDGFVLKARSPSCGVGSTPWFTEDGSEIVATESGLWAHALQRAFPAMPIVDESADLSEFLNLARAHWQRRVGG